ncbi:serine/threonine-protein kinase [Calothrix rhizosoleniae]|uniref:serine/threonine-protein kinase n=1 Tax=Calothrix rhizosoleniae TaxID=888997 RepID=UPI000B498B26|nr:serine/threonine-protein kinase [Calothrix rhizosoleniae]
MTRLSQVPLKGYTIVQELGKGGFGTTYLVTLASNNNHLYALKHFTFPSNDPSQYAIAQRLFQREVAILKTLNGHSQIPNFIDYWEEKQEYCLVQEFVPGELLREELEQGNKSEAYVVELLTEILEILRVVHSKKIIHRDINPSNIIRRSSDNQLVLIDFGAGAIQKVVTTTTSTQVQTPPTKIYTLGYAPIEQTQGNPQLNSDIYALGITAIQMLTGIEPQDLQTDTNGEIIWCQSAQVSDRLVNILSHMVRYDYRNRYQSVDEVLEELTTTPVSNSSTQVLTSTNNFHPSPAELGHNQINIILFFY